MGPNDDFRRELAKIRYDRALANAGERSRGVFDFALMGLRSLIIVNGGALIGLFTFLGNFAHSARTASTPQLYLASLSFVLGLVFALVAVLFAYLAQSRFVWAEAVEAEREGLRPLGEDSNEKYSEVVTDHSAGGRRQAVAITFAVSSVIFFLIGAVLSVVAVVGGPPVSNFLADPSAPAWAQALLSALAIVFSGALIFLQHELDTRRQIMAAARDYKNRMASLAALAKVVRHWADNLKNHTVTQGTLKSAGDFSMAREHLAIFRERVAATDVSFLKQTESIYGWHKLIGAMLTLDSDLALLARAGGPVEMDTNARDSLTKSFRMVDQATREIEALASTT